MLAQVVQALWFILPAYVANSAAIDVSAIPQLKKYSVPVDGGRTFRGKRILGDGKTWRGFIAGVLAGLLTGLLQSNFQTVHSIPVHPMTAQLGLLLGLGAMLGDMAGSFVKRQSGRGRGAMVPLLDQLDYIVGAFILAAPLAGFNATLFVTVAVVTVPLHVGANLVAYFIKIKDVPW